MVLATFHAAVDMVFIFLAALAALYLTLVSESVTEWVGATLEF